MTLTIGGQPVLHPSGLIDASQHNATPIDFWMRANGYSCPRGEKPGVAWVLMRRSNFEKLDANAEQALSWTSQLDTLTIPRLYIVNATCMDRALASVDTPTYLVELRDVREILRNLTTIAKRYNIRKIPTDTGTTASSFFDDSLSSSALWTWQTMLDDIWGELPSVAGSAPSLPYTPDGTPEGWTFDGISAWEALHQILGKVSCTTAYSPLADVFSYVRLGVTQEGLVAARALAEPRLVYDFNPLDGNAHDIPETIRVIFPKHTIDQEDVLADPWHTIDKTTGVSGAITGTVLSVHDDLAATYDSAGTLSNSTELNTRAIEIASNLTNLLNVADDRSQQKYRQLIVTLLPNSEISETIWRDYGDADGLITEVISRPEVRSEFSNNIRHITPRSVNQFGMSTSQTISAGTSSRLLFDETTTGLAVDYNGKVVLTTSGSNEGIMTPAAGVYLVSYEIHARATYSDSSNISGATNTSPIVLTTSIAHGRSVGEIIMVHSVAGNEAANGVHPITVVPSTTQITLGNTTGSGDYTSGGKQQLVQQGDDSAAFCQVEIRRDPTGTPTTVNGSERWIQYSPFAATNSQTEQIKSPSLVVEVADGDDFDVQLEESNGNQDIFAFGSDSLGAYIVWTFIGPVK